jgi:hypothetical protein
VQTALTADPDADLEHSLVEWRRYRRHKRVAGIHWIDALYQAYITALFGAIALFVLTGYVGDDRLGPAPLARAISEGDDWLGVVVAVALAIGLRSGSRGGPLALEQAEVRHVLLAPVDRTTAVLGPVVRQLRFFLFVAAVVGAEAGVLASRRLEHHAVLWVASGVVFAAATVALAYGAALCAGAWRMPSPAATAVGVVGVSLALGDALDAVQGSPFTLWGRIGMWPERFSPWGFLAIVLSLAVLAVGLLRVGDLSVEAAERRSTLVGQLRFAATLQDLRTVLVLRRQLAMELPRLRPWIRLPVRGTDRLPVWTRGWRGVLRWPAARVGRMVLLAVVAGLSLRGVWTGTTPLLAAAALALFVAGLDAVESLAQEIDHPSRAASTPIARGDLHLRHLPVAIAVMVLTCAVGAGAAVAVEPSLGALAVAAMAVVPAALGGVAGAVMSALSGAPDVSGGDSWTLVPPEVAGMRVVARAVWPLVLAVGGTLPVLAARSAANAGSQPAAAAASAGLAVVIGFGLVAAWVRKRDDLHAAWKAAVDQAFPDKSERSGQAEEGIERAR